jgi:hypothetical protein
MKADLERARRVKNRHQRRLLALDGVQGVGMGDDDGRPLIKVYVDHRRPAHEQAIPRILDDVPVVVEEAGGEFTAY